MQNLMPHAERLGLLLKERKERLVVAESSTGGLISAAMLSVPGASDYFLGGAVVYTRQSRNLLLGVTGAAMAGLRPATEAYALLLARTAKERFGSDWAVAETGAAGPTGNRYGDAAGHSCIAVVGSSERAITLETGKTDRPTNMRTFAAAALDLLAKALAEAAR